MEKGWPVVLSFVGHAALLLVIFNAPVSESSAPSELALAVLAEQDVFVTIERYEPPPPAPPALEATEAAEPEVPSEPPTPAEPPAPERTAQPEPEPERDPTPDPPPARPPAPEPEPAPAVAARDPGPSELEEADVPETALTVAKSDDGAQLVADTGADAAVAAPSEISGGREAAPSGASPPDGGETAEAGPASGTGEDAETRRIRERYYAAVARRISSLGGRRPPAFLRRIEHDGPFELTVLVVVDERGRIVDVSIEESSGIPQLDDYAVGSVRRLRRLVAVPPELGAEGRRLPIPLAYEV